MLKKGLMIVLSSPSGGGKTTVAGELLRRDRRIVRSVSCTTRKPRAGERHGRDYFFITLRRFKSMVSQKAFLEWAKVHENYYGTPRLWVERKRNMGKDVLFVVDVQGGKAIRRQTPGAVLVFLKPPSLAVLKKRLLGRGSDDAASLGIRLRDARWELKEGRRYTHQVLNDRLGETVEKVAGIIEKERHFRRAEHGTG